MNIFLVIALAMLLIIILLRRHIPIGPAILAGGLLIWALVAPQFHYLVSAFTTTLTMQRTYDLILALYFVMCLEIELRTSGALDGMIRALQRLFASEKFTLAIMPAFLGLLPSLGGARFSAPIVEAASRNTDLTKEHKAAINFWFRHIFEFSSPIIPGMIMACSIAGVAFSDFIAHLCWLTLLAFALGWLVLIRPLDMPANSNVDVDPAERRQDIMNLVLSLSPVVINFMLVVFCDLNASTAMALVTFAMIPVLRMTSRVLNIKEVFTGACDWKMLMNVLCILYFIQILTDTNVLHTIVEDFKASPLPVPVIIAAISFIIGILTGLSQGHVAIVMPIVAALSPGDLNLAGVAMAFGVAGQMLTPTHMCFIVTLDYFKADFFKTLKPMFILEVMLLTIFSIYINRPDLTVRPFLLGFIDFYFCTAFTSNGTKTNSLSLPFLSKPYTARTACCLLKPTRYVRRSPWSNRS